MKIDVKFSSNDRSLKPSFSGSNMMNDGGTYVTLAGKIMDYVAIDDYIKKVEVEQDLSNMLLEAKESGIFDGEDGFSPSIEINPTENGNEVVIVSKEGEQTILITNGKDGKDGIDGEDGYSPEIKITETDSGYNITVKSLDKEQSFSILHGKDGKDGADGKDGKNGSTPVIVNGYWYIDDKNTGVRAYGIDGERGPSGYTPYISNGYWYINGQNTRVKAAGLDGEDGIDGDDGFSPIIETTETDKGHQVVVTDIKGKHLFEVLNGKDGKSGKDGIDGKDGTNGKDGADGKSGVYILSENETFDDAPEGTNVIIDPNGEGTDFGISAKAQIHNVIELPQTLNERSLYDLYKVSTYKGVFAQKVDDEVNEIRGDVYLYFVDELPEVGKPWEYAREGVEDYIVSAHIYLELSQSAFYIYDAEKGWVSFSEQGFPDALPIFTSKEKFVESAFTLCVLLKEGNSRIYAIDGKSIETLSNPNIPPSYVELLTNPDSYIQKSEFDELVEKETEKFSNAFTGTAMGLDELTINDISPVEHELQIKVSSVNLLSFNITGTTTINGVTFTVNEDKTITANGTATENIDLHISHYGKWTNWYLSGSGNVYRLTGCPNGGGEDTYYLHYRSSSNKRHKDTGNGVDMYQSGDTYGSFMISVIGGVTLNEVVFKPQLIKGISYLPWANEYFPPVDLENVIITCTGTETKTATSDKDGKVEGLQSYYPTTTLTSNIPGVIIHCTYNKDINEALDEYELWNDFVLQEDVVSIGAERKATGETMNCKKLRIAIYGKITPGLLYRLKGTAQYTGGANGSSYFLWGQNQTFSFASDTNYCIWYAEIEKISKDLYLCRASQNFFKNESADSASSELRVPLYNRKGSPDTDYIVYGFRLLIEKRDESQEGTPCFLAGTRIKVWGVKP